MNRKVVALWAACAIACAAFPAAATPPPAAFPGGFAPGGAIEGWDPTIPGLCVVGSSETCAPPASEPASNTAITVGSPFPVAIGVYAICTGSGANSAVLQLATGTTMTVYVSTGPWQWGYLVTEVISQSAGAGCTFQALR